VEEAGQPGFQFTWSVQVLQPGHLLQRLDYVGVFDQRFQLRRWHGVSQAQPADRGTETSAARERRVGPQAGAPG